MIYNHVLYNIYYQYKRMESYPSAKTGSAEASEGGWSPAVAMLWTHTQTHKEEQFAYVG